MKKSLASGVGVAAALMVVFGASANANPYDPYSGETYEKAAAAIGNAAVIATRVGEYLPTEQCIVTGSRSSNGKVLLDLNCNDNVLQNGHSGVSVASPEGRAASGLRATADYCAAPEQAGNSGCADWCSNYPKICSAAAKALAAKDQKTTEWCSQAPQAGTENCAKWCSEHEGYTALS